MNKTFSVLGQPVFLVVQESAYALTITLTPSTLAPAGFVAKLLPGAKAWCARATELSPRMTLSADLVADRIFIQATGEQTEEVIAALSFLKNELQGMRVLAAAH